jgi:hypothetical protein
MLALLIDDLEDDQRMPVVQEAWQAAQAIGEPALRADVLIGLLPAVSGDVQVKSIQETRMAVEQIEDGDSRAEALSQLLAYRAVEERAAAARAVLDLWC